MLDHITFTVSDVGRAKAFYDAALAPMGVTVQMQVSAEESGAEAYLGYGEPGKPYFWFSGGRPLTGRLHVAFAAKDRATVDAFYRAAMAAGGRDNGPPGLRPEYHATYYGAFVLDPDGHNIEAVCHAA
ncbi:MAG TPA: VOC family protein [Caulobacteraceae bacterium]|nr:VOC family protein [Caulobacteraceae bacterium]